MITLALLLACSTASTPSVRAEGAEGAEAWVVVAPELRYREDSVFADGTVEISRRQESWVPAPAVGDERRYEVLTTDAAPDGTTTMSTASYLLGRRGFGWDREVPTGGSLLSYDPPKLVLSASPRPGESWSAVHPGGRGERRRSCSLTAGSPFCDDGLTATCRSTNAASDVLIRDHFCRGEGWRGAEAALYRGGERALGSRTAAVEIQGRILPDPPDVRRPYPAPGDVTHPASPPQ